MSSSPPYSLTNESITVVWEGKSHTIQRSAPNFASLRSAIISERWDDVPKHLTVSNSLQDWAKGKFTLSGNTFFHDGTELPQELNRRIVSMATKGESPEPLFRFWERLLKNPSWRSVKQLYPFLQHKGIPITEDGCFLAYKSVKNDYKDVHSGQFDNKPGSVLQMPRNQISDDPQQACHEGFHVGALEYARSFHSGGRLVVCKVDPSDVVCIPYDSSHQKMRVCKYEVIGNHNGEHLPSTTFKEDTYEEAPEEPETEDDAIEDEDSEEELDETEETPSESEESEEEDHSDDVNPEMIQEDDDPGDAKNYYLNEQHELPTITKAEARKERAEAKSKSSPPEEKRKPKRGFAKLDKLDMEGLMEQSIDDLRQYAGKGLLITGASKITGGKAALVSRILAVRE